MRRAIAMALLVAACSSTHDLDAAADAPLACVDTRCQRDTNVIASCASDSDCASAIDYACSYQGPGCDSFPTCIARRMCDFPMTFCGCDGVTFTSEICFNGIPHPWMHMGPC